MTCSNTGKNEKYGALPSDAFGYEMLIDDKVNISVAAMLSDCYYYEACLQKGIANGEKWVYSNRNEFVPQSSSFDQMTASGKPGANCAMLSNWAFMDLGVMPVRARFWGGQNCEFAQYDQVKDYLDGKCEVINLCGERPTFAQLFDDGKIRTGDIFLCNGHTFIYGGGDIFFAAGHDTHWHTDVDAVTEDSNKAVFETFITTFADSCDYSYKINYILRLYDDYTPDYYRNAEGKLVKLK